MILLLEDNVSFLLLFLHRGVFFCLFVCCSSFLSSLPVWQFAAYLVYIFLIIHGHIIKIRVETRPGGAVLRETLCNQTLIRQVSRFTSGLQYKPIKLLHYIISSGPDFLFDKGVTVDITFLIPFLVSQLDS